MTSNYYNALLLLKDGKSFFGTSIGAKNPEVLAQVCFTTGMTGYQHIITDPSFAEQIIVFTFPHIGNVGVNDIDWERKKIFAKGIVIREMSYSSHLLSKKELSSWLEEENLTGISGIDTRALTHHLRNHGSQTGLIHCFNDINKVNLEKLQNKISQYTMLSKGDLSSYAIAKDKPILKKVKNPLYKVIIVDFGMKLGIASCLTDLKCDIKFVHPKIGFAEEVLRLNPDGILLSNGPGNPSITSHYSSKEINILIKSGIPILGICLGHQLISLALGAQAIEMKNAHRGMNHPVYDIENKKIEITSQNHGFTIDRKTLPDSVIVTHFSLFDNTVEGIKLKDYPVFSVQHHPEGYPGPNDSLHIFYKFINMIKNYMFYKKELKTY